MKQPNNLKILNPILLYSDSSTTIYTHPLRPSSPCLFTLRSCLFFLGISFKHSDPHLFFIFQKTITNHAQQQT
jgi:hypothetical protein